MVFLTGCIFIKFGLDVPASREGQFCLEPIMLQATVLVTSTGNASRTVRSDVTIAQSAHISHISHMRVKRYFPVECHAETLDGRRRLDGTVRDLKRRNIIDTITSMGCCAMYDFGIVEIELQSIYLKPRMHTSRAVLELGHFNR